MKTILITGGAGFIGSHLTKRLLNEGNRVIVVDNLMTTHGDLSYLAECFGNPKFHFLEENIVHPVDILMDNIRGILDYNNELINEIYNLASPASVKLYSKYPLLTMLTSTEGLLNVFAIAKELGTRDVRILETSTSEAYGDPLVHPQVESYTGNVRTQCIRGCYDEAKRMAEVICYIKHLKEGYNTHIARLFNVYGPNNTDDRVMPTFISQALNGDDVTVFGDGTQTRSFCYVDDIVEGLIKLQASDYHEPVNLGNPYEITIQELAETIIKVTNSKSKIVYKELPDGDPTRRCPDISLAKKILKWEPKTMLADGIKLTIDWLQNAD